MFQIYSKEEKRVDEDVKRRVDNVMGSSGIVILKVYPDKDAKWVCAMLDKYSELYEYIERVGKKAWVNKRGYIEIEEERSNDGVNIRVYELKDRRYKCRALEVLDENNGFKVDFERLKPYLRGREKALPKWVNNREKIQVKRKKRKRRE